MSSEEQVEFEFYFKSELQESQWRYLCRYVRWFRRLHKHGVCHSISFKYTSSATDLADVIVLVQDLTLVPQYTTSNKTIYYYTPHVESRTRQSKRHKSSPSFTNCFTRYVKPYSRLSRKNTPLNAVESCLGFAMWQIDSVQRQLYLALMCTKPNRGLGRQILDYAKLFVRSTSQSYQLEYITLSSLVESINFYRKCGFTHFHPPESIQENEELITCFAEQVKDFKFANRDQALQNNDVRRFLRQLIRLKLYANPLNQKSEEEVISKVFEATEWGFSMALKIT